MNRLRTRDLEGRSLPVEKHGFSSDKRPEFALAPELGLSVAVCSAGPASMQISPARDATAWSLAWQCREKGTKKTGVAIGDDTKRDRTPAVAIPAVPMTGTVYLVGAGPGDPELLTLKAHRLIRAADVILHDDLVSPEIVALAAHHAQIVNVGKRCGEKKFTQVEINQRMIASARQGLEVVRLKSGDPGIFGRLAEETDALDSAGISYEIVPGITAGVAAAASVNASLTDRRTSSRIVVISGHQAHEHAGYAAQASSEITGTDWRGLAREDATFVIYMPGRDLARLQGELLEAGFAPDFPAVIVSRASTPDQREYSTTLAELDSTPPMEAPSIILLGRTFAQANRDADVSVFAALTQETPHSDCSSVFDLA